MNKKLLLSLTAISAIFALTGCAPGLNQNDVYACEDWASAWSLLNSADTGNDGAQLAGFIQLTADNYQSASEDAKDPELSDLLSQLSTYYSSASKFVAENNPDLIVEVDAEDKDVYRKCLELGINPELTGERIPDWYESKSGRVPFPSDLW